MSISIDIRHSLGPFRLSAKFEAGPGLTMLFGHSGSGKTTLVNAIAGLLTPDQGRITVNNRVLFDSDKSVNIPTHKRRLGYVFQDARLFPHMTVQQNLRYGQRFNRRSAPAEPEVIGILGIGHLLGRYPVDLSGGEKMRVAIGRALLSAPEILLLDEPLAALDDARKEEILPYLERLRDQAHIPILYVSHSVSEVARLANTLVLLDQGKVRQSGPVSDLLSDPDIAPIIGLREAGAMIQTRVSRHHDDGLTELDLSGGTLLLPSIKAPAGSAVRVRIHAHEVMISLDPPASISALNVLPVTVNSVRMGSGPGALVRLDCGEDQILARITRRSAQALDLKAGKACYAIVKSVSVAQGDVGRAQHAPDLIA